MNYSDLINSMTLEELVGQVMCPKAPNGSDDEIRAYVEKYKPGGIFVQTENFQKIRHWEDSVNKAGKIPLIVSADIEHGAPWLGINMPNNMAWGACDDEVLIETAGEQLAKVCRKHHIHWTFAPIVDLNINPNNPESNIRSISDEPKRVVKIAGAYMRGLQNNGYMVSACKHFPGQGCDDRNSHFVTVDNNLSKTKWMQTYGYIYKKMIAAGTPSIMVGHISLKAFETDTSRESGLPPATLSKALMTDLLKKKLKFDGCIVSDAMCMVGVAATIPAERMIVEFFNAGGDMYLFPKEEEYAILIDAVRSGEVSTERLKDAVARVLKLKEKARLFENQETVDAEISLDFEPAETACKIAEKSVKIVRNLSGTIPVDIKNGAKILFLNMMENFGHEPPTGTEFSALKKAFADRGYLVDEVYVPQYNQVKQLYDKYDLILINCKMSSRDYHGGSLRVGWDNIMLFWHGVVFKNPNVIFISFGDPYKIREFPYLKEYINAFSFSDESQTAVARLILGEIPCTAKNPVDFKPYFDRED